MSATGRWGWAGAAALTAGVLWLAGRPGLDGRAAERGDAPAAAASGLDVVPADGVAVVSVRVADLWQGPAFKTTREKLAKEAPDMVGEFSKQLGVSPDDVERITAVMPELAPGAAWVAFVTTTKPYDAKKVLAAVAPDGDEEKVKDHALHVNTKGMSVVFLSDRTYLLGDAERLRTFLGRPAGDKEGPLTPALREADKHLLAAGLNVEALVKFVPDDPAPEAKALKPLLKAHNAVLTADLGDGAKADLRLTFEGEADAKNGAKAVDAALDLARAGMVKMMAEAGQQPGMKRIVALMEQAQAGLRAAKVEQNGSTVEVAATAKIDPEKVGPDVIDAIQKVRDSATRISSINNLKQLALAMYNYESANGHFPANAVYDKNGKALLSWRVLILPYIEQDALYKEFRLDEPWDSEHNKPLLEKMPPLFGGGDEKAAKSHETHYQGFVGKGAFFEGEKGAKVSDITDGTSNTVMLVEAKKAVPWSKPDDVPFDQGKLVPKLGGLFEGIFNGAMCDGSVRGFPLTIKEDTLHALVTRNGGEVVDPNK